ncbi:MAG: lysine--tRNA ligase [bacterium]
MPNEKVSEYGDRLQKLAELKEMGINPYPSKTNRTHQIKSVLDDFGQLEKKKTSLVLAGRLMSQRGHGNLTFGNIQDGSGKIQIALSKKEIGAENYKIFTKLIDIGDFIEIKGVCFLTHKGEKSIMTEKWMLLSKALRPLPEKWHGLQNEEERYRKRYLDLLINNELKEIFKKKEKFWETTRQFMKNRGFTEVETPTLETTTGGAEANPFITHHNDLNLDLYLRISIGELWHKRLMAAGYEKTFEIGRMYRNEGSSPDHLQEFTNMEFYWAYANYEDGMKFSKELFQTIAREVFGKTKFKTRGYEFDLAGEWKKIDYQKEILKQTKIDILKATEDEIKKKLKQLNIKYEGTNKERLVDSLWKYCRKTINGPAFLVNHPKLVSPLAKEDEKKRELTERFQIIIAGSEAGNGYSELNNPVEQKKRFEIQQKLLEGGDKEAMMPDWEFVEMVEYGMPPTCGFGFGERLFCFLADISAREATLFPLMKPKNK